MITCPVEENRVLKAESEGEEPRLTDEQRRPSPRLPSCRVPSTAHYRLYRSLTAMPIVTLPFRPTSASGFELAPHLENRQATSATEVRLLSPSHSALRYRILSFGQDVVPTMAPGDMQPTIA